MDKHDATFDPSEFMHFLDGTDMTEEAKREYLEFVWQIVSEFAAIGFGVHPVQQALDAQEHDKGQEARAIREMVAAFMNEEGT